MENTQTVSKSFRLPANTVTQLDELASLLKETKTNVLALAVDRLYKDRERALDEDVQARRNQIKGKGL